MTRAALHQLVDQLPETEVDHIAALVQAARDHDRVAVQCLLAEEVPPDEDELAALAEADRDGESVTLEELERRYGM